MFDFLRNLTQSAAEKRQEQLHAYVDEALSASQQAAFERELAQDPALQAEVEQARALKAQLRRLPRRPLPRSFTLDPAQYGRPQRQPLFQFYPALRVATALTAFLLVLMIGFDLVGSNLSVGSVAPEAASETVAMDEAAAPEPRGIAEGEVVEQDGAAAGGDSAADDVAVVEVTRVVIEETVVEVATATVVEEVEVAAEEPAIAPPTGAPATRMEATDTADLAAADADDDAEPPVTPTPTSTVTPAPQSTATVSLTPIPSPTPPATAVADNADAVTDGETAVAPPSDQTDRFEADTISAWRWLQIGLLLVVVLLAGLTWYVRRQM